MASFTKLKTAALLAAAGLLCTIPLGAALKGKPSTTRVKARPATSASRSGTTSSKPSSHTASWHSPAKATTATAKGARKGKPRAVAASKPKFRGQQSIDQTRTVEIQQALIRNHYLDGEATGEWDQATREALTRLQGGHHWQTKILPDSRALIMLGLGPSHQNLLNPESAAIAIPYQSGIEKSDGSN